jgi:hypothetical protein
MKVARGQPKGATGVLLKMWCKIILKYKRKYCYITQLHMLDLIDKYSGVDIARSTLNLWINWLEDEKWTVRYSGYLENKCGKPVNRPSSFYLTRKAVKWLISQGVRGVERLLRSGVRFSVHHIVTPNRILAGLGGLLGFNKHLASIRGRASPV